MRLCNVEHDTVILALEMLWNYDHTIVYIPCLQLGKLTLLSHTTELANVKL